MLGKSWKKELEEKGNWHFFGKGSIHKGYGGWDTQPGVWPGGGGAKRNNSSGNTYVKRGN
jgi:hypothetical protein